MAKYYFNGKLYSFPGAFGAIKAISSVGASIPEFQVGLIMGQQDKGKPYSNDDPFVGFSKLSDIWDYYGRYSDIAKAFEYAKKKGMSSCFCVGMSPSTQAECTAPDETPEASIVFTVKDYGALANDHLIEIEGVHNRVVDGAVTGTFILGETVKDDATGLLTGIIISIPDATHIVIQTTSAAFIGAEAITGVTSGATCTLIAIGVDLQTGCVVKTIPPKNSQFLAANVDAAKNQITVQGTDGLSVGQSYIITDNDVAANYETIEIQEVNSITKVITLVGNLANAYTTAAYARIFQQDTDNEEVSDVLYSQDEIVSYYAEAEDRLLIAEEAAADKLVLEHAAAQYVPEFTTSTAGTSPVVAASDYNTAFTNFPDKLTEFSNTWSLDLRIFYPITDNATVHGYLKNFATARRALGKPISGIVGGGDNDIGQTALDEIKAINHQDVDYLVGGIDDDPAYISNAAELFGNRIYNAVAHNQTFDKVIASTVEAWYNEESAIGNALINGGGMVITIPTHAKGIGYVWAKGQSTLLANTVSWNMDDTTYLIMQRDLSYLCQKIMVEGYEGQFVGNDNLTVADVSRYAVATIKSMMSKGIIISGKVDEIVEEAEGWTIKWAAKLPSEKNYIGIVTQILA